MLKHSKIFWLTGIGALFFVLALYGSAYFVAHRLKAAVISNNIEAISDYIDFVALRSDIKVKLQAKLNAEEQQSKKEAGAGAVFANALMGSLIDTFVTPENLGKLISGDFLGLEEDKTKPKTNLLDTMVISSGYASPNRFAIVLTEKANPAKTMTLYLHRQYLFGWRLASVDFAPEIAAPEAKPEASSASASVAIAEPITTRPAAPDLARLVGQHPADLLKIPEWQARFQGLLGDRYAQFAENLSVASGLEDRGDVYFASGCAPHECTALEAAFTINKTSGAIVVSILAESKIDSFGNTNGEETPEALQAWYVARYIP